MFKKLGLSLIALVAAAGIAFAGGAFNGFPIVGDPGNDICLSFGNNGVCNQYSPAGPTNVPATSTFPSDTNVTGAGATGNPATINIPAVMAGAVALDAAPLTGTSITVPQGVSQLVLDPAGTIATLTIVLPIAGQLIDGQELKASSTQTITALTVTAGSGTTIVATATTTLGPTTAPLDLIYHAATAKWVSG